ncbi:MAG TPA: S41 family peptidase [Anaerolineales bacterium]|nr:S41 family peptidase [Anaerolineales bacterium]
MLEWPRPFWLSMNMNVHVRTAFLLTLGVLLAALGGLLGFALGRWAPMRSTFPVLSEAFDLVQSEFFGPLPERSTMERGAVRGLVESLGDPYSLLVDPAGGELESDILAGEYGGIGADIVRDGDGLVRLVPFRGGPADRAGIREGEVLVAVDGMAVESGWSMDEVTSRLRGPVGAAVLLTVASTPVSAERRSVRLVLESFPLPTVSGYLLPGDETVGVVRISLFSAETPHEVDLALDDLSHRGAKGFLLDLRGNPGGLLDSAVDTARLFLRDGTVASETGTDGRSSTYEVQEPGTWIAPPLAIVVDRTTASAAEILAGALQQRGRGVLAGQPTLGKGTVQSVYVLTDGSSLHLTTAMWRLPDGEPLPPGGLVPELAVSVDPADPDVVLRSAAAWLREHGLLP